MKQYTVTLILILTFTIGFYTIYLNTNKSKKEDFKSDEIITSDMKNDEDYRQCIDQNAQLHYQSSGKYPGCHQAVRELSNWGMGPQTDLGHGQIKYVCPISCLLKQPSDCLQAKADNQNNIILDISKELRNFKADTPITKSELNKAVAAHDAHLDQLYGKKHIQDVVNYIYTSGRQISDPIFQKVLEERTTVAMGPYNNPESTPTPKSEIEMAYTKPPEISLPTFGGFGANNLQMNTSRSDTSHLLGF
jgi:hypothetical protein